MLTWLLVLGKVWDIGTERTMINRNKESDEAFCKNTNEIVNVNVRFFFFLVICKYRLTQARELLAHVVLVPLLALRSVTRAGKRGP